MSTEVLAASETSKSELREMLSVYLGELSQYGDVDLEYRYFDSYWLTKIVGLTSSSKTSAPLALRL